MRDSDVISGLTETVESDPRGKPRGLADSLSTTIPRAAGSGVATTMPDRALDVPTVIGQPARIGRYLVLRRLGEGGMGVVYAGYDEELDRRVAIKLLHPSQQRDSKLRARIIREAQALARVSSPNVVHAYEVGEFAEQIFIVMEFVNGTTLSKWQAEKRRSWQEILRMSDQLSAQRRENTRFCSA